MPDPTTFTISVSLDTDATPPVTCCPDELCVDYGAKYTIKWQPSEEGWTFQQIKQADRVTDLPNPPFTKITVADDEIEVEDDNDEDGDPGTWSYSIQVKKGNSLYWSDPKIINKGGS